MEPSDTVIVDNAGPSQKIKLVHSEWLCITPWGFQYRPYVDIGPPNWLARKFGWWLLRIKWVKQPITPIEMLKREDKELENAN